MKKIIFLMLIILQFCFTTTSKIEIKTLPVESKKIPNSGTIIIPKIKLKEEFKDNNELNNNIIVIQPSNYPNVEKSLLILAGHSGFGKSAFFNNLYKLKISDEIYIEYDSHTYMYKIIEIYKQLKDGKIDIKKVKNKNTLALVTCTNNNKKMQTVYICILIN